MKPYDNNAISVLCHSMLSRLAHGVGGRYLIIRILACEKVPP